MSKIIIGIHGLANKPEKDELERWWKQSILEGLKKNCSMQNPDIEFRMVYWADFLYKNQLHTDESFKFDPNFNDEPYIEAQAGQLKTYDDSFLDEIRAGALGLFGAGADFLKEHVGLSAPADWMISKLLKDLDFYYDENRQINNRARLNNPNEGNLELALKVLRDEFKSTLRDVQGNELMIVAHSMGSIIAYDSLRDLGQSDPDIKVAHFVTIGSPLGLPHVRAKIIQERGYDGTARTPTNVTKSWLNFADKKDPVAIDIHLKGDYKKNAANIEVKDDLVANDYTTQEGERNPHKSYGYLRTPEFSKHVKSFLES